MIRRTTAALSESQVRGHREAAALVDYWIAPNQKKSLTLSYRALLAGLALLLLSSACPAEPNITILKVVPNAPTQGLPLHLPPVEYDRPYKGKLTIETVTLEQLLAQCTIATASTLGCAFQRSDSCRILLLDEAILKAAGWTKELMLRHEIAHCNGWPSDHPGKRPYPGPGRNQEAIPIIPEPLPRSKAGEVIKPVLRWYSP